MATDAATEARKQANLRLLQRTCGTDIVSISQTATHVVMYEYKSAWHKCDVEGSCFLVTTRSAPYYQLIILNRNSDNNFIMNVTKTLQAQHQEPYLIVKQDGIKGIWFHDANERVAMFETLQETIQKLKQGHIPIESLGLSLNSGGGENSSSSFQEPTPVDLSALLSPLAVGAASMTTSLPPSSAAVQSPLPQNTTPPSRASSSDHGYSSPRTPSGPPLDKKSLQLALLSLIQDDRFLDLLHSQYLRVESSRNKRGGTNKNNGSG